MLIDTLVGRIQRQGRLPLQCHGNREPAEYQRGFRFLFEQRRDRCSQSVSTLQSSSVKAMTGAMLLHPGVARSEGTPSIQVDVPEAPVIGIDGQCPLRGVVIIWSTNASSKSSPGLARMEPARRRPHDRGQFLVGTTAEVSWESVHPCSIRDGRRFGQESTSHRMDARVPESRARSAVKKPRGARASKNVPLCCFQHASTPSLPAAGCCRASSRRCFVKTAPVANR